MTLRYYGTSAPAPFHKASSSFTLGIRLLCFSAQNIVTLKRFLRVNESEFLVSGALRSQFFSSFFLSLNIFLSVSDEMGVGVRTESLYQFSFHSFVFKYIQQNVGGKNNGNGTRPRIILYIYTSIAGEIIFHVERRWLIFI